jgi:hypothetical protein
VGLKMFYSFSPDDGTKLEQRKNAKDDSNQFVK